MENRILNVNKLELCSDKLVITFDLLNILEAMLKHILFPGEGLCMLSIQVCGVILGYMKAQLESHKHMIFLHLSAVI